MQTNNQDIEILYPDPPDIEQVLLMNNLNYTYDQGEITLPEMEVLIQRPFDWSV